METASWINSTIVNDWLASGLGAGDTQVLHPRDVTLPGHEGAGAGRLHTLLEPVPLETIVERVKAHLKLSHVRLAKALGTSTNKVSTIAICAGSGKYTCWTYRHYTHRLRLSRCFGIEQCQSRCVFNW
jgi:putative NIF3 family GTP cyclohydrolase 1 type 2